MLKKNYKFILGLLCGLLISISGVYATETIIESINVSYDNSTSGGKYTTVQESIDELYEKSGLLKEKWIEKDLNGADPVLEVEGSTKKLIPITIDNDGTVHYANLYTKWYDYSDKRWANAVILVDNPKNGGEENYTYKTGDIIKEEDIESYFVWIPRYKYKIWDLGKYTSPINAKTLTNNDYATSISQATGKNRLIEIVFESKEKTKSGWKNGEIDESSLETSFAQNNAYLTHPAFTLGNTELNGIWVGKFETGYNQNGNNGNPITGDSSWTTVGASITENNSKRIIIKPNIYSWRSNTLKNNFLSSYNYARDLESHMMKNTEWGAVIYLSHSAYGIGTEVRVNNVTKTGYSADANTNQSVFRSTDEGFDKAQPYNTNIGYLASTSGNITGVYDMSGCLHDSLAAYMENYVGSSELTLDELNTKYKDYVDKYSSNNSNYSNRILGDATAELGPFYSYNEKDGSINHNSWYADAATYISTSVPWFIRGGCWNYGIVAGQFSFNNYNGASGGSVGTRLVLSPK